MDNNAPIKYSDLFQPDNSIKDLTQQLEDLSKQYNTLMKSIKAEAQSLRDSLASISGASTSGQAAIKAAVDMSEKLAKKNAQLIQSQSEEAQEIARLNLQIHENNNKMKLQAKIKSENKKVFDIQNASYDELSAKLSLNTIELHKMSAAERKASEEGQRLTQESAAIRIKLKQMNEEVGNHVLSVGDYGIATASLASDIRNGLQAMTQLRIEMDQLEKEGQKGGERWTELAGKSNALAKELKDLKRAYTYAKLEANALGQQTGYLNDITGALSTGAGGLSVLTGTLNLFGGSASGAAEALVQLNSVMALANGATQFWNGILKQGNFLLKVRNIQLRLGDKAMKLQTKSTIAATIAQKALNIAANANPYVALAVAIGVLVGILTIWVSRGAKLIAQQKLQNQQMAATLEYMEAYDKESTRLQKDNQKALEQELAIAKARKAGYTETWELENKIQAQKEQINDISRKNYKEEIENVDKNRKELERLRDELLRVKEARKNSRVEVQLDAEKPARKYKVSKIIDILQEKVNLYNKKVEVATELTVDQRQLEADAKTLREQHRQQALEIAALERSTLREAEDVQMSLINNRFEKQRATEKANTARQIIDLKVRLQTENNLTLAARKAINNQILDLRKQLNQKLREIDQEETLANRKAMREWEDIRLSAFSDTAQNRRNLLKTEYERDIEDIEWRLATEEELTDEEVEYLTKQLYVRWAKYYKDRAALENTIRDEQLNKEAVSIENRLALVSEGTSEELKLRLEALETQRKQELNANRALAVDQRQDEAAIDAKYQKLREKMETETQINIARAKFEVDQEYARSIFDLREHSEQEIYRFELEQQKEAIKKEIELQRDLLKTLTGEAKENTETYIKTLENQIFAIDRKLKEGIKINNIWELFGFNSKAADAIQDIVDQVLSSIDEVLQARIDAADKALDKAKEESDAYKKYLEIEMEARANGYANQVEYAQKELALAKEKEEKALKEKEKAQRAQERINSLTQASSLVTASANIWAALGAMPALAIAGITAMWASFIASKIRARQIVSESYGEGHVELLQGGSHRSGRDIDLGRRSDGTRRRAEGGEFFAVINKRNSRKYRTIVPDVIKSLNNGTFTSKYLNAKNRTGGLVLAAAQGGNVDISALEKDVRELRKQNDTKMFTDSRGNIVLVYKNLTRKLKN